MPIVSPRKRKRPSKAGQRESNVQAYSVREFFAEFPNDDACLTRVMEVRYGLRHVCRKCGKDSTFHRLANRKAFACSHCGVNLYPCAGTIFQDSRTPLQTWFYAIYLFIATRHGVSGKELQRTLGVTYKTAYRIGMQIRDLMGKVDSFQVLKGHVEIDETYFGGYRPRSQGGKDAKTIIMGMKERGGRIETKIIPNVQTATLRPIASRRAQRFRPMNWLPTSYSRVTGMCTAQLTIRATNTPGKITPAGPRTRPTEPSRSGSCSRTQ
jgi:transposase